MTQHCPNPFEQDRMKRPQIDHVHKAIFVQIGKVAGCSINDALGIFAKHATAQWWRTSYPREFAEYFTFAIVRNPFDRVVSAWEFGRKGGYGHERDIIVKKCIDDFNGDFGLFCTDALASMTQKSAHFLPQVDSVCGVDKSTTIIDYVGRFETLIDSWAIISKQIGNTTELGWVNRSVRRPLTDYYISEQVVEAVIGVYRQDFDVFGYDYDWMPKDD